VNDAARALLAHASVPPSADTTLFARLIGARVEAGDTALLGLDHAGLAALIGRHFPQAPDISRAPSRPLLTPHHAFVRRLHGLLMWHDRTAADARQDAHCLATIICAATLRPDHLWRDLGLDGRDDVTEMLQRHYPALVARNTANLRWKKFLAQEVACAEGVAPTCAPGCPGCEDYAFCYPDKQ
jgi:nitrogen fixation protein NifQ